LKAGPRVDARLAARVVPYSSIDHFSPNKTRLVGVVAWSCGSAGTKGTMDEDKSGKGHVTTSSSAHFIHPLTYLLTQNALLCTKTPEEQISPPSLLLMPAYGGFVAHVRVDGQDLPEYGETIATNPNGIPTVSCWVPSEVGKASTS
jgi:hypothetical protein